MKTLTILTIALAALAVAALPASAQSADRSAEAGAIITTPLLEPAPAEQAPPANKCNGQEEELTETFFFDIFQDPSECEPTCVDFCDSYGGYLISSFYEYHGLTCTCRCCVPRQ